MFNLTGTPNVVKSMWPVPDAVGPVMADVFWKHLSDFMPDGQEMLGSLVAMAINAALIVVAAQNPADPLSYASFIHVGGP